MLHKAICLCALACMSFLANAQTPAYTYSAWTTGMALSGPNIQEYKQQCIYTSKDFPTMPSGRVKAIYWRIPVNYWTSNTNGSPLCYFPNLSLKMGYSADTAFKLTGLDSFRTNLVNLYGPDTFRTPCSGSAGDWIKIPVTKGNFQYTPEKPFIVEIAIWPKISGTAGYPSMMGSHSPGTYRRSLYELNHAATTTFSGGNIGMDLGIDLGNPSEVVDLSNITSIGLFPIPTTNGRFNVSLDSKDAMKEITITVSSITGQQVLSREYHNAGNSFFQELNMADAAKGIYFVRIAADGEVLTRRIVVE